MKRALATTVLASAIAMPCGAGAETGMGMVVEISDKTNMAGKARRIDLQDGKIVNTSAAFGSGIRNGRISPDGTRVVTVNRSKKVEIWDLNGTLKSSFSTFEGQDAYVSWTKNNSGRQSIWVGGVGKLVRYNTTGVKQETLTLIAGGSGTTATTNAEAAGTKVKTVSFDERTAGGRPNGFGTSVLLDTKNSSNQVKVVKLGPGCSVGPSPNGQRLTRNLWEKNLEHQTMAIHARTGAQTSYFYIYDLIYKDTSTANHTHATRGFSWNRQTWPSNSNDIILLPAGRCFPQMTVTNSACSTMPWIYNMSTKKAFCLYDANGDGNPDCKTAGKWWYIFDFHRGKISSTSECANAGDCSDGKVCTQDVCNAGKCSNPAIATCCTSPSQCNDGKACTKDVCSANECSNPAIANCCTSASQCDDGVVCTEDKCVANQCENPPLANCCKVNSDCNDGDPCTTNRCNVGSGQCTEQTVANCCQQASDCDDDDLCTTETCIDNSCSQSPVANCCQGVEDCDDGNVCTTDTCDSLRCSNVAEPSCCHDAADCVDEDDCTEDVCNLNSRCENPPILNCEVLPSIELDSPRGGAIWEPGTTVSIEWSAQKIDEVVVFLSKDGGETWESIGQTDATSDDWGSYQYAVPADSLSEACVVLVEDYFQQGSVKSDVFAIGQQSEGSQPTDPTPRTEEPRGMAALVGGCAIAADGPTTGALPWMLGLILVSLVCTRARKASQRDGVWRGGQVSKCGAGRGAAPFRLECTSSNHTPCIFGRCIRSAVVFRSQEFFCSDQTFRIGTLARRAIETAETGEGNGGQ